MASKSLSIDLKEENKQGISSILGLSLDCRREKRGKTEYPLRRTLSADMSSKRFLSQSSLKKVASSEEISTLSQESGDNTKSPQSRSDVWSSIQSQKLNQSDALNPPYVHPLTRRSSRSLSSKSLEMCTESLGSETGSDVCSIENSPPWLTLSPPSSPPHPLPSPVRTEEHHHEERNFFKFERKQLHTEKSVNYNCTISRRSPPRSFPPPLPSLSRRDGGPCLHMKPHRQEGRLVLEAVAAPSHNYLHAERQGGRLLLSFISTGGEEENNNNKITSTEKEEEMDQVVEVEGDHEVVQDDDKDVNDQQEVQTDQKDLSLVKRGLEVLSIEKWKNSGSPPPPVMELHRSIAKLIAQPFVNLNPWTQKKKKVEFEEENDSSSVLSRANGLSGGCFNVYECSWKEAVGEVVVGKEELGKPSLPLSQHLGGVLAASAAASPPSSRCHSLPRRTQHLWILERYCIATT